MIGRSLRRSICHLCQYLSPEDNENFIRRFQEVPHSRKNIRTNSESNAHGKIVKTALSGTSSALLPQPIWSSAAQ